MEVAHYRVDLHVDLFRVDYAGLDYAIRCNGEWIDLDRNVIDLETAKALDVLVEGNQAQATAF